MTRLVKLIALALLLGVLQPQFAQAGWAGLFGGGGQRYGYFREAHVPPPYTMPWYTAPVFDYPPPFIYPYYMYPPYAFYTWPPGVSVAPSDGYGYGVGTGYSGGYSSGAAYPSGGVYGGWAAP
jgi:hypothetical protein